MDDLIARVLDVVGDSFDDDQIYDALDDSHFNVEKAVCLLLEPNTKPATPQANKTQSGKPTTPKAQSAKSKGKAQTPKAQTPKAQTPKAQTPKAQTPKAQTPKAQTPQSKPDVEIRKSGEISANVDPLRASGEIRAPVDIRASGDIRASMELKKQRKQMSAARRREVEELLNQRSKANGKEEINLVVVGHVDAGKSTIMGHLLFKLGVVSKQTMHRYERDSQAIGKESFKYAWVLDEREEERARGVTIDVGITHFATASKQVTLLDAPGHRDFIPNMISGAAQADVAILVVNAIQGEFESNLEHGQTKEHALLIRSLGVMQIIVAVNKLDMVDWSKQRFEEIQQVMERFLKQAQFRSELIQFVPCSGMQGENLSERKEKRLCEWYNGRTLIEAIDNFKVRDRLTAEPFRLCVSDVFKPSNQAGFSVSGKLETGIVSVGDVLLVQPLNEFATVRSLRRNKEPAECAMAGDNVEIGIIGNDVAMENLAPGCFLSDPEHPMPFVTAFRADISTFNVVHAITQGHRVELHSQTFHVAARVSKLLGASESDTSKKRLRALGDNVSAYVEIRTDEPIGLDLFQNVKKFGRFMLREDGVTVAAGVVKQIL